MRRRRVVFAIALMLFVAAFSLAIVMSYESPCGAAPALAESSPRMKAVVARCYGPPSVLRLEEVVKPMPAANEVLVRVHAATLNPYDWHMMRGSPYLMRFSTGLGAPNSERVGLDFAGTVAAVGSGVKQFKVGDEVFGSSSGALAEYVLVRAHRGLALKPENLTFEQAAGIPVAAVTALQGLRDHGRVQPGQQILINGASGGVGTFAVQLAKTLGAEVTGVCSTRNVELVRSLGADHVIDYTKEDFSKTARRYDLIIDNVANRSIADYRRVLKDNGRLVIIGASSRDPWIGPMILPLKAAFMSLFVDQAMGMFVAKMNSGDLDVLAGLARAGKMTTVIDRRFNLNQAAAAMEYLEAGRARGKVVINVASTAPAGSSKEEPTT